jgi:hypothetical protein
MGHRVCPVKFLIAKPWNGASSTALIVSAPRSFYSHARHNHRSGEVFTAVV